MISYILIPEGSTSPFPMATLFPISLCMLEIEYLSLPLDSESDQVIFLGKWNVSRYDSEPVWDLASRDII